MKIQVDNCWWKTIFDEIYLVTDARSVCDQHLTTAEIDFLTDYLPLKKKDAILDLCGGQGRHAIELTARGFSKIYVIDYSKYLLSRGLKIARKKNLNTTFIRGDARNTGFAENFFQYVLIMGSSFGYFTEEAENVKILQEAFRVLVPGGMLLIDLPFKDYILKNFKPSSNHHVDNDITVIRERELGEDIIFSSERVISKSKGCIRHSTYCTRLYSRTKIKDLMCLSGFSGVECKRDFMDRNEKGDFGFMTNRMIVTAKKA